MSGPAAVFLPGNRLHLQHGPIDLVIAGFGPREEVAKAYRAARDGFANILPGLVAELPVLRMPLTDARPASITGPVAARMVAACQPFAATAFITPMAAVAGAVADHILAAMGQVARLQRAYVNNGGDIALYLAPGTTLDIGMVGDIEKGHAAGSLHLRADDPVRGIATSGCGGRSFSLGIADAVTVLADSAARADAAATLIGNAVDCDHPGICRQPARRLDPDSDLGDQLVTVDVPPLPQESIDTALQSALSLAVQFRRTGLIRAAAVTLQGHTVTTAAFPLLPPISILQEASA